MKKKGPPRPRVSSGPRKPVYKMSVAHRKAISKGMRKSAKVKAAAAKRKKSK